MAELSDEELLQLLQDEDEESQLIAVEGASGAEFHVLTVEEAKWYDDSMNLYTDQFKFENIADLQDLDRLLALELLSYRYVAWLIRESDYDGNQFDDKAVREHKDKVDKEIRGIKAHMGIGRKSRVESEQQSVADYLTNLLARAREFGVHRDDQNAKAIDLMADLKKMVGLYKRADEEERKHLGVDLPQIFQWIDETMIPEFDAIDAHFRVNQKAWIRDLS